MQGLDEHQDQWPLSLVKELYVFGSFARGATEPHDLDIDVEHDIDQRWAVRFADCLAYGRDHFSLMKRPLTGGKRGCQFTFNFRSGADFAMTPLWRQGDPLAVALKRLHAIGPDPSEGRAPRDAMLAQFDGLDRWIPRPIREAISAAAGGGAIALERVVLVDGEVTSARARAHLAGRWTPSSPLYRAAHAVVADWERRGIDPCHGHLHGADIQDTDTPYYAGFGWRYFASIRACLTDTAACSGWRSCTRPRPGPWTRCASSRATANFSRGLLGDKSHRARPGKWGSASCAETGRVNAYIVASHPPILVSTLGLRSRQTGRKPHGRPGSLFIERRMHARPACYRETVCEAECRHTTFITTVKSRSDDLESHRDGPGTRP